MIQNILFMAIHVALAIYFLGRYAQTKKNDLLYWLAFNAIFVGIQFSIANRKYEEKFSTEIQKHLQQYHQPIQEPSKEPQ